MKKFLFAVVALFLIVACGENTAVDSSKNEVVVEKKNVYDLGADIYNDAAEKLRNVKSESEIEALETEFQDALDALENSKEMAEYVACVRSGDSVALKKYDASRKRLEDAAAAYSSALLDAYMQCGK